MFAAYRGVTEFDKSGVEPADGTREHSADGIGAPDEQIAEAIREMRRIREEDEAAERQRALERKQCAKRTFGDVEVQEWAMEAVGPAGMKRGFGAQYLANKKLFTDLVSEMKTPQELEWVVEGLLPRSYLAVLGGDSKCGKSWFVTAMALSIATGEPFMGLQVSKGPVLWCSFEENTTERHLAINAYKATGKPMPERMHFYTSYERVYIDDPYAIEQIGEYAWGLDAKLLVVDPLHAAYGAGSISDGTTARRVLAGVKHLCKDLGLTVIVIHHLTKAAGAGLVRERMADSGQILAAASMDLLMEARIDKHTEGGRTIRLAGRGRGSFVNRDWLVDSPAPMVYELVEAKESRLASPLESAILEALEGGAILSSRDIAERIGFPLGSVRNSITKLVGRGHARISEIASGTRLYGMG